MIENLNEHQPHITITTQDNVHVVPVSLLRNIANGSHLADNDLIRAIASALLSELGL